MMLRVNGAAVRADVEPRVHLADFLREHLLLTGTHLGCEQGVCGACTVLLDDEPARACLTLAALCEGRAVRTIEGLDDPVTNALRAAFTAEHALQCGYCTPGMLVTARDIVRRLPDADDDRVRLELAGNLCRCTGYGGIARAIRRVLDAPPEAAAEAPAPLADAVFPTGVAADGPVADGPVAEGSVAEGAAPSGQGLSGPGLTRAVPVAAAAEAVWRAIQDPALIAGCVPGARLLGVAADAAVGDHVRGEITAALGPIRARFTGEARVTFTAGTRSGRVSGTGRDGGSGTMLDAEAAFRVEARGEASVVHLDLRHALRGPLAQFGRPAIVEALATEMIAATTANLEARLRDGAAAPAAARPPGRLGVGWLLLRVVWRALRDRIGAGGRL